MSYCYNTVTSNYHGKAKHIIVWENGDFYADGHDITINPNYYRTWNGILSFITDTLRPSFGAVRNLIHLESKEPVHSFKSLESNGKYIAVGAERLKQDNSGYKTQAEKQNVYQSRKYYTESVSNSSSTFGIPTRGRKIILFIMTNGKSQEMPCKVVLTETDIESWGTILEYIARSLDIPESIQCLYTVFGDPVENPRDIQNGCIYVAVPINERFVSMDYVRIFKSLLPMREIDLKKVEGLSAAPPHISDPIIPSNSRIKVAKSKSEGVTSIKSNTRSIPSYRKPSQTEAVDSRQSKSISTSPIPQTKVVQSKRPPNVHAASGTIEMKNRLCSGQKLKSKEQMVFPHNVDLKEHVHKIDFNVDADSVYIPPAIEDDHKYRESQDKRKTAVAKTQNIKNEMAVPISSLPIIEETLSIDTGTCDLDVSPDIDQDKYIVLNENAKSISETKICTSEQSKICYDKHPTFDKKTEPHDVVKGSVSIPEGYKTIGKNESINKAKPINKDDPINKNKAGDKGGLVLKDIKVIPCPLKKREFVVSDHNSKKLVGKKSPLPNTASSKAEDNNESLHKKVPTNIEVLIEQKGLINELPTEKGELIDQDKPIGELPPPTTNISQNIKLIPCPLKKERFVMPQDSDRKSKDQAQFDSQNLAEENDLQDAKPENKYESIDKEEPTDKDLSIDKEEYINQDESVDELPPPTTNTLQNIKVVPCRNKKEHIIVRRDSDSKSKNELAGQKTLSSDTSKIKAPKSNLEPSQPPMKSKEKFIYKEEILSTSDNLSKSSSSILETSSDSFVGNYSDLNSARHNGKYCYPSMCGFKKDYGNNRPMILQTPKEFIDDVIRSSIIIMERANLLKGLSPLDQKKNGGNELITHESNHDDIRTREKYNCCEENRSTARPVGSILENFEVHSELNKKISTQLISPYEVLNQPSEPVIQTQSDSDNDQTYSTFSQDLREYISQTNEENKSYSKISFDVGSKEGVYSDPSKISARSDSSTLAASQKEINKNTSNQIINVLSGPSVVQPATEFEPDFRSTSMHEGPMVSSTLPEKSSIPDCCRIVLERLEMYKISLSKLKKASEVINQSRRDQDVRDKEGSHASSSKIADTFSDRSVGGTKYSGKLIAYKNSGLFEESSKMFSVEHVPELRGITSQLIQVPSAQESSKAIYFVTQSRSKPITGEDPGRPNEISFNNNHASHSIYVQPYENVYSFNGTVNEINPSKSFNLHKSPSTQKSQSIRNNVHSYHCAGPLDTRSAKLAESIPETVRRSVVPVREECDNNKIDSAANLAVPQNIPETVGSRSVLPRRVEYDRNKINNAANLGGPQNIPDTVGSKSILSRQSKNDHNKIDSADQVAFPQNVPQIVENRSIIPQQGEYGLQNIPETVKSRSILQRHGEQASNKLYIAGPRCNLCCNHQIKKLLSRENVKEHRSRIFDVPEVREYSRDVLDEDSDIELGKESHTDYYKKAEMPIDTSIVTVMNVRNNIKQAVEVQRCPSPSLHVLREDDSEYELNDYLSPLTCHCRQTSCKCNFSCIMKQKNAGIQVTESNIYKGSKKKLNRTLNESEIPLNQESLICNSSGTEGSPNERNVEKSHTAVDERPNLSHSIIPSASLEGDHDSPLEDLGIGSNNENSEKF